MPMKKSQAIKTAMILLSLLQASWLLPAQGLQRSVSLRIVNEPLQEVLAAMEARYGLQFSYSPDLLPMQRRLSFELRQEPLKKALDEICSQLPVAYKAIGLRVLLKPGEKTNEQLSQLPRRRPEPRQSSPIYPPSPGQAAERQRLSKSMKPIRSQQPTTLSQPGGDWFQALSFDPRQLPALEQAELVTEQPEIEKHKGDRRLAQISLLPYLGTNLGRSDEITNNLSINLLWGANGGVDGLELGLFYNKVANNVHGLQIAGLGSRVGGNVNGTQVGGLFNIGKGEVHGLQASGLFNVSGQGGHAVQGAGLFNISYGDYTGVQASGLFNAASGCIEGLQVASIFNRSAGKTRSQVAGIFNIAGHVEGGQVSAVLNAAGRVDGFQVGLINVADTVSGLPLGLLNIVKNGYNRFELSANDALFINASLKLGAYSFYNIFHAGLRWDRLSAGELSGQAGTGTSLKEAAEETVYSWGLGYGIGTTIPLGARLLLNAEAVAIQVNERDTWAEELNLLNQLRVTLDYHGRDRRTSLFVGPVFNLLISRLEDSATGERGSQVIHPSYKLLEQDRGRSQLLGWIGLQGGIRF